MAKRSGSGRGLAVVLIVFILLAIIGIGLSVHFYQQWKMTEQAVKHNQKAFQDQIKDVYSEAGWNLPSDTRAVYGIVYDQDTYAEVADKLQVALRHENIQPLLPWRAEADVESALSVYSPEGDDFDTVDGLLNYYSEKYQDLTKRADNLIFREKELMRELDSQKEDFEQTLAEKNQEVASIEENYAGRLQEIRAQYAEVEEKWETARDQRWDSFAQLENTIGEMEEELETAQALTEEKEAQLRKMTREEVVEEPDEFSPEGEVLAYDRHHELVMVAGGEHAGHRRNTQIVLYRQSPTGAPILVGTAVISRVFDTTSMANIIQKEIPILEGHLYVDRAVWEDFDMKEVAMRPIEEVEPVEDIEEDVPDVDEPVSDIEEDDEVEEGEEEDDDDDLFVF